MKLRNYLSTAHRLERREFYIDTISHYANTVRALTTRRKILLTIDMRKFKQIQHKYISTRKSLKIISRRELAGHIKYFDINYWMLRNLTYVYRLSLNKVAPQNIIDLGTGFGYFPFACKYYGHSVIGIDEDKSSMYDDMIALLKIDRKFFRIEPYKKLPEFGREFDLATALMVSFNRYKDRAGPKYWGIAEWDFFLDDLKQNHLTRAGRLFMTLNQEKTGTFYDASLEHFFKSRGAKILGSGNIIIFDKLKGL